MFGFQNVSIFFVRIDFKPIGSDRIRIVFFRTQTDCAALLPSLPSQPLTIHSPPPPPPPPTTTTAGNIISSSRKISAFHSIMLVLLYANIVVWQRRFYWPRDHRAIIKKCAHWCSGRGWLMALACLCGALSPRRGIFEYKVRMTTTTTTTSTTVMKHCLS